MFRERFYKEEKIEDAQALKKIRRRIKIAQDRQKSYADVMRKDVSFEIGDQVFLKIAPMRGVVRFGKKEILIAVIDRRVHTLRTRKVPLIKVQWSRHGPDEATWEKEVDIIALYPNVTEMVVPLEPIRHSTQ
ncbi:hypothetical protein C2S51_007072 [Perilla frutescens var. frutescens]|nr:hypothetical protein C2S51_007072 [Perilla frutescens var. frutescens]